MSEPTRTRHRVVLAALRALDADFLARAECFFGGGTRIVLGLDEYRESADIDFLCASREGYRKLRETVSENSLGHIAKSSLGLAREVKADRYGIRTFLAVGDEKLKIEIILEGRIGLAGGLANGLPVPALDEVSCCAEKFLANADRWGDESALGRDVIDLAFMATGWGREPLRKGLATAADAYGKGVARDAKRAATKMLERAEWRRRCVASLSVSNTRSLLAGLRLVSAGKWTR
jgi:Nucleotidyl transferase AbiEii toxin, Type IV TA system